MKYVKYTWVGNRISEEDMGALYRMRIKLKKPITVMVAEAVSLYVRVMNDEADWLHSCMSDKGKERRDDGDSV